ncbi:MAG: tRNA (N6-isopentenyl adenosine(37)-C2)-methylthiotransferase MiaB [Clostridiales Family XIII bacterium]|jgi:tRNA-2-methylthio-N6-dimethylallyladenosine synthase|nr:tRNA (N6-isopentenyl adenosine(37)-C2)-methylthiotransferase MiaB [Clostridiales Family XIII bacterium]
MENKTYYIITLGCQMNERDSENVAGILSDMGYSEATARENAGIIIVNTCSVRENADNRFFGILGQLKKIKEKAPETIVGVCGCMMQQQQIVDKVREKYSWVDLVFGTHNIHMLSELLGNIIAEHRKIVSILGGSSEIVEGLPSKRMFPFKAYVDIMHGCNNFCTYCIVPFTRGREISRSPGNIVREIENLVKDGVLEVTLLGQNVNSYDGQKGVSQTGDARVGFSELLQMIENVQGLERVRFMTSHPKDLDDETIAIFGNKNSNLCPGVHLPVQSGSSRILEAMNRRYTKEDYLLLVEKLRAANPDIVITTDFIVGFPGETEEDFDETIDLIEKVRYDSAFTFIYSPRFGTPAAKSKDQVPEDVKHERFNRMVKRLNEITLEKNKLYLAREEEVLVEGVSKTNAQMLQGRTHGGKLVNFPGEVGIAGHTPLGHIARNDSSGAESLIGRIVPVRIVDVNTFSFIGEMV